MPRNRLRRWLRRQNAKLGERGQSLVEYLLVLLLAFSVARFVYFNPSVGIKPNLEKTMLRLGSYLEANLKSGTQPGPAGTGQVDRFAGTSSWKN